MDRCPKCGWYHTDECMGESMQEIVRQHELIQTLIDSQTKALSIACAALGKPTASAKSEITEEWSDDGKTITVYPCPKCGNSEPDWDASMAAKVKKLAEDFGWDGMCPLLDWLGDCLTDLNEAKK